MGLSPRVIVLNGGSSSGKSSLARALQDELEEPWLRLGVDDLLDAAPARLFGPDGLTLGSQGSVTVGDQFIAVEAHWMAGIAAIARHGGRVIVEDNFVSGPAAQRRWCEALEGIETRWVGVHCASQIAAQREAARGDRTTGMAARQATAVHQGVRYDVEVDTSNTTPSALAKYLRRHIFVADP